MKKVIVVGGGPAGMMAAYQSAKLNNQVVLFEKNDQLGKKLLMTGNGRCNVTNNCDVQSFLTKVNHNPKFLYKALHSFTMQDTLSLLNGIGVQTKEEDNHRMFPISDSSFTIRDTFKHLLIKENVDIHYQEEVTELLIQDDVCVGIKTNKNTYYSDVVILTTGGKSYPLTGSTGDGYEMVKDIHTIIPLRPGLTALNTKESWIKEMQGLSLKDVRCSLNKIKMDGDLLFTHFGISGPMILNLSSLLDFNKEKEYCLHFDLYKNLSNQELDMKLIKLLEKNQKKQLQNILGKIIPNKMIVPLLNYLDINIDLEANQLRKEKRKQIIHTLKDLQVHVYSVRSFKEAMITMGGISIKEVNPSTMESKKIKNLRFAGEILDVDACTGGYNLQIAWSTGYVAGQI